MRSLHRKYLPVGKVRARHLPQRNLNLIRRITSLRTLVGTEQLPVLVFRFVYGDSISTCLVVTYDYFHTSFRAVLSHLSKISKYCFSHSLEQNTFPFIKRDSRLLSMTFLQRPHSMISSAPHRSEEPYPIAGKLHSHHPFFAKGSGRNHVDYLYSGDKWLIIYNALFIPLLTPSFILTSYISTKFDSIAQFQIAGRIKSFKAFR